MQNPHNILISYDRIKKYVVNTPVLTSKILNDKLKHNIYFKLESLQHTGAFKVRGVLNYILSLEFFPEKIISYSTGNYGIAVAYVGKKLGIKTILYLPKDVAYIKIKKARYYGARIIFTDCRRSAALLAAQEGVRPEALYLPSSEYNESISGVGTVCYEALNQLEGKVNAVFASCAKGGLLSGCLLSRNLTKKSFKVFGVEPMVSSKAYCSVRSGVKRSLSATPITIADGLKSLSISNNAFEYLKLLDGFFLVKEEDILYWTVALNRYLGIICEPSSAINMAAVVQWIQKQHTPQNILVIISGGNISLNVYKRMYDFRIDKVHLSNMKNVDFFNNASLNYC